jgi:hypothetical protein
VVYHIRNKEENEPWEEKGEVSGHVEFRDPGVTGPLKFAGIPLSTGLDKLFSKAGQKYDIDTKEIGAYGGMNFSIEGEKKLSACLKEILEPLKLGYYYDPHKDSVHIAKAGIVRKEIPYDDICEYGSSEFRAMMDRVKPVLTKDGKLSYDNEEDVLIIVDNPDVFKKAEEAMKAK